MSITLYTIANLIFEHQKRVLMPLGICPLRKTQENSKFKFYEHLNSGPLDTKYKEWPDFGNYQVSNQLIDRSEMVIPNVFTTPVCHKETQDTHIHSRDLISFRSNVHTIDASLITVNFPVSGNFIVSTAPTKRIRDYRLAPTEESSMAQLGDLLFSLFLEILILY